MAFTSSINDKQATSNFLHVRNLMKFAEKVYGAVGEYITDENGSAKRLYFQDPSMKDVFNFYPDRVCVDITFKHFEIDLTTFIFLCEDSNGRNSIIALGFLQSNDAESLAWLFDTFKKHNPNWRKIKSMAIDPEIKPREVVRESFPHPLIVICFFHAYTSFKNDVVELKDMGAISEDQQLYANDLFKNLYFAQNQSEFELRYQLFLALPAVLVSYLEEVWIPKQHEWRIPLDYDHENVFLNVNSFLQELNNATYSIFAVENNYIEFIKKIFLYVLLKKKEKHSLFLQPVSFLYSRFSPEHQISKSLTPYAAKFVIEQLDLSAEITTDINTVSDTYLFNYLGISVSASATACSCHFFLFTLLPCRHIFAVRRFNYLCVFDESLIDYSWNMKYYQHTLTCMQDYLLQGTENRIPQDSTSRTTFASHLFEISFSSMLELPKEGYESRTEIFKKLIQAWKVGEDVSLQFLGIEKDLTKGSKKVQPKYLDMPCSSKDSICENASCSKEVQLVENKAPEQPRSHDGCERNLRQGLSNFNTNILNGTHVNLAYLCCVISITKSSCVEWLRSMELIVTTMKCPNCNNDMKSRSFQRLTDGVMWCCTKSGESKKSCSKRCSVRAGTWLDIANMTLEQILVYCYMWINKFGRTQIISEIGISSSNYMLWDKFCTRVCDNSLNDTTSMDDKADTSNYKSSLDKWLEKNVEEDQFVKFLKDASDFHSKESKKTPVKMDNE